MNINQKVEIINWFKDERMRALANVYNHSGFMTPEILSSLHAAETITSLKSAEKHTNTVFLWDRYIYSSYASIMSRGVSKQLATSLVDFFPDPDLIVLIISQPKVSYDRIISRGGLNFYEAGLDIIYRGCNLSDKYNEFEAGLINPELIRNSFISLMTLFNSNLSKLMKGKSNCETICNFDLYNIQHIDLVLNRIRELIES